MWSTRASLKWKRQQSPLRHDDGWFLVVGVGASCRDELGEGR